MRKFSKLKKTPVYKNKTKLSLVLATCFGFAPAVDAEPVDVTQMVNSISGLLGGTYQLNNTTGAWDSSGNPSITNPAGNTPQFGTGALNDPFQNGQDQGVVKTGTFNGNNNLYGTYGLISSNADILSNNGQNLGIYNFGQVNQILGNLSGNAYAAYGARTAFGGVGPNNNIIVPGTGVTNNYFKIQNQNQNSSDTNTAQVLGNLQPAQIATGATQSGANTLLGQIYTNITNLAGNVNVAQTNIATSNTAFSTYSTDMQNAISTADGVGSTFVSAVGTSGNALNTAISSLNSLLNASNSNTANLITGSATGGTANAANFQVNGNSLNTLATIYNISSMIPGGIVAQSNNSYSFTQNYTTVMTELAHLGQALDVIANNVLNTPLNGVASPTSSTVTAMGDLNQVLTELTALQAKGADHSPSAVQQILQGYINPNTQTTSIESPSHVNNTGITNGYQAIYNAFTALTNGGALTKIQAALTPQGGTAPTLAQTVVDMIQLSQELASAQRGVSNGNLNDFFSPNSFPTSKVNAAGLQTLYETFGVGNSSAAYSTLTSALQKLTGLVSTNFSSDNAHSLVGHNTGTAATSTANKTTMYPTSVSTINNPSLGGNPSASKTQINSWIQQRIDNQATYNTAYNKALGTLLQEAMNYSANTQQLSGMLNTTNNTSLLSNILNTGINNAAANILFNGGASQSSAQADAINTQAQYINNIQAIFNSENLLNSYVNAITKNYVGAQNQEAQASALTYLSGALNASSAQNGLIATTKQAIIAELNANPTLSASLSSTDFKSLEGMNKNFTTQFLDSGISISQFANAASSLSTLTNDLTATADTSSLSAATAQATFTTVKSAVESAGIVTYAMQQLAGVDQAKLATTIATLITTPAALNSLTGASGTLTWSNLTANQQSGLELLMGVQDATTSTTAANTLVVKLSGLLNSANWTAGANNPAGITSSVNNAASNVTAFLSAAQGLYTAGSDFLKAFPALNNGVTNNSALAKGLVYFMQNNALITQNLGALGPSVVSQFESGKLTPQDLSKQIATIQQEIAGLQGLGTNAQSTQSGSAALGIGLQSMLGSGVSAIQNLGFAQASVNTMYNDLKGILPILDTANGQVSTTTLNTISSAISSLNTAIGKLYAAGNQFFAGTGQNIYNLTTTANMAPNSTNTQTGTIVGVGDSQYTNSSAGTYLGNLNSLYTMSSLLGDGFATSSAMGSAYTTLFGDATTTTGILNNTANITGTSATLSADISTLTTTSNFQKGVTLTEVVNALMPIQQQLISAGAAGQAAANAAAKVALANLAATPSAATALWGAYQAVMGFGDGGVSGQKMTVNYISSINNVLNSSGSDAAKQANLNSASAIVSVIQDAQNLITANSNLTGSTGIANSSGANGYLSINSAATTQNNGAAFSAAIAAANAFGNLLQYIKASDLSSNANITSNVQKLIQAVNSYDHNFTLLNNLLASSNDTTQVATDVLNYLQAQQSYKDLTLTNSSGGSLSSLSTLQSLLNRLQYLENMNSQVQNAITNNPYAIVMNQQEIIKSNSYQNAAKTLVTTGNTASTQGLFNAATTGTFSSISGTNVNINGAQLGNFDTQFQKDISAITAWNAIGQNLNTSNTILQNPALGDTVPMAALGNIASSVYSLTGFITSTGSSSVSDTQAAVDNLITNWQAINTQGAALTQGAFAWQVTTGASNAITASMLTDPSLIAQPTGVEGLTLLGAMQSVVSLSEMLKPASGANNGLTGNNTNITAVQNALTNTGTPADGLNGSNGQIYNVINNFTTPLYMSTNAAGQTTFSTSSSTGATKVTLNLDANASISATGVVPFLTQLVQTIEDNSATNQLLVGVQNGSITTLSTDQITTLENTLQGLLGGTVGGSPSGGNLTGGSGNVATLNNAASALSFLRSVQTLVGGTGALQAINNVMSSGVGVVINSNVGKNIGTLLNNALQVSNDITNAGAIINNGATKGSITTLGGVSQTAYAQISQIVNAADKVFNAGAINPDDKTANTPTPQITAVQAMVQASVQGALSGLSQAAPANMGQVRDILGLMALELKDQGVSGNGFGGNSLGNGTVQQYFFNATPAQLVAAAQAALKSTVFNTGPYSASMQNSLVNSVLNDVFNGAKQYTDSMNSLSGLLNSSNSSSNILQMAIANALGVQAVNGLLNKQNTLGVASKNGILTNANIATIQNAINKMNSAQQPLTTYNNAAAANTPVGRTATLINNMITASNNAQSNLNVLSGNGIATSSTASDYQKQADTMINDQALLLAENNSYSLGNILGALQQLSQSAFVDTGNSNVGNMNAAVQAIYQQIIASPTINYATAANNLNSLIGQLQSLQTSLINQLASMSGVAGVSGGGGAALAGGFAQVDGVKVQAENPKDSAQHAILAPVGQTATKSSVSGLIQQVNNALVYAKAAQAKLSTFLKSNGYIATASHMPMSTMNSNGNMYGIDVQFGYKQFFGKKKRWGVRYYANFSYQHGTFMTSDASELDNFVYGAGVDALYNFYESKDGKYTSGLFAGLMLEGSSWAVKGQSYYDSLVAQGLGKMNTSYFQIPINLGFRTNVNKHNGFEIGLRIPLATNYYYKGLNEFGDKLDIAYKRNVSVFFNYVYNF
ncbi:outer membrane protein [Helicobacter ailurogastricus]|uniref:outer membrane protein n=1 Tax=Helicobacter ailurogastricus TaxID=1578720 RepID=UPI0025558534|nr:outer membrane protein [Helicobacter ailurogastricus]